MAKTVLTFYCDDTSPHRAGPEAFGEFLDFVKAEGIAGESIVLLGTGRQAHGLLHGPTTDEEAAYLDHVRRAYECGMDARRGVDAHMELMTHGGLFDFEAGGEIGEHETGFGQLFVVVDGAGWVVSGSDRHEVGIGDAVFLPRGVMHAKGS